jgi:hypothetical protein
MWLIIAKENLSKYKKAQMWSMISIRVLGLGKRG